MINIVTLALSSDFIYNVLAGHMIRLVVSAHIPGRYVAHAAQLQSLLAVIGLRDPARVFLHGYRVRVVYLSVDQLFIHLLMLLLDLLHIHLALEFYSCRGLI